MDEANDCKTENAGAGRVEVLTVDPSIELAVHEAVGEVVAGGSSIKAFDPCLDTGEVGEGPAVEEVGEPVIESQPEQLKKFEK